MQDRTLGRYRIIEELGRGNMGCVYVAHDPEIDRQVAIKTIRSLAEIPVHERQEARERFLREARSIGRLQHPGIITVYDVGEADDQLYLAMELLQGTTLDHFCSADNLLPVKTVIEMVAGIGEALDYAHAQGIIHRDIKPANLMRVGDTSVKIMDFGLARPSEAQLTQDGTLLGTPSYMSPEQIRGAELDGRSDLFSLGVVLFELLTGERPTKGESVSAIIYEIINEPAPVAAEVSSRVSTALSKVLHKALTKKRAERFATGEEFALALRQALTDPATPTSVVTQRIETPAENVPDLPPPPATLPRSSPLPFVVGLVVLIVLVGAGAYYFRDSLGLVGWFGGQDGSAGAPAAIAWAPTRIRTEPPGLPVSLDGILIDLASSDAIQLGPAGPFGLLTAEQGCRVAEHQLAPADAGAEIVLVLDANMLPWTIDPGITGLQVYLNGELVGSAPVAVELDLCRNNQLTFDAPGYHPESISLASGALPLDVRSSLNALSMREIPKGSVLLTAHSMDLNYYIDGKRVDRQDGEIEVLEGQHTLRITNRTYWVDVSQTFMVEGGTTVTPELAPPAVTTLVVQAFPANCEVYLRKKNGKWKFIDETPLRTKLAVGNYQVRVKLKPTGETRDQEIKLTPGENPPVRVSFGRG
jgi:hypothetical protein